MSEMSSTTTTSAASISFAARSEWSAPFGTRKPNRSGIGVGFAIAGRCPRAARRCHRATADDLDGIVEYPRSIAGVHLALLFRQIANGRIKVSFRSMGDVDVADLAHRFGGGGHKRAAGASLEGSIADVQQQVLAVAREYLASRPGS